MATCKALQILLWCILIYELLSSWMLLCLSLLIHSNDYMIRGKVFRLMLLNGALRHNLCFVVGWIALCLVLYACWNFDCDLTGSGVTWLLLCSIKFSLVPHSIEAINPQIWATQWIALLKCFYILCVFVFSFFFFYNVFCYLFSIFPWVGNLQEFWSVWIL